MALMERCLACRARLADAPVCPRCGTDFSVSRRAEQQATAFARLAVRELLAGQTQQATAAAEAATQLASPLLAQAVLRMVRHREVAKPTAPSSC